MAASIPPNPRLGKSQALNIAQNTTSRLASLVPTLTTPLSPVTVYQPGPTGGVVGNELLASAGTPVAVSGSYGVWVAPDFLGNGQEYYVQIECFGGGGGGGGGSATQGGGGGGGGEYACEPQYPVKPGVAYAYVVGLPGSGGVNNNAPGGPGTWTPVGGLIQSATPTIAVNPVHVGDFVVLHLSSQGSAPPNGISGGNCTWQQVGTTFNGTVNTGFSCAVWVGTATATGSAPATVTYSGTPTAIRNAGHAYTSSSGTFTFVSQGNLDSAGTSVMPSVSPSAAGQLYSCFDFDNATATAGTTTGYTYEVDSNGNGYCFNPSCAGTAQAPVWNDLTGAFGTAVMLSAGGGAASTEVNPGTAGTSGGITVFDTDHGTNANSLANGVIANGGQGGDQTSVGIGGLGGQGSGNAVHFPGGDGGTNGSSHSSDNPLSLAQVNGMFVGNTLGTGIINCWYILNDLPPTGGYVNDDSGNRYSGVVTNYGPSGGGMALNSYGAPSQVPAFAQAANPPTMPNAQAAGTVAGILVGALNSPSAKLESPDFGLRTTPRLTVSCWIQCDPSGTWGNTVNGSYAMIAANTGGYNGNSMKGYALFLHQDGSPSSPSWSLHACVGNGTSRTTIPYSIGQTPGAWYYVVMTYNSGLLTLYVNGTSVGTATSSGYTSVPTGQSGNSMMAMDISSNINWFFGAICNIWWAADCATSTLVTQVYGGSGPATGGAGGGASGGPSAPGSAGVSAAGALGGAGGTPPVTLASLVLTTTKSMGGYAGAAAGAGNPSPSAPSGGLYGGGGGGSGDMPASPVLTVLTVPFTSAATYYGTDASSNPGTPYSVNQQANPGSGLTSVLFAGGAATDAASGSKNSVLLLPRNLKAMLGNGTYTVAQVFITFTNAAPNNAVETILELGYSADTALPQTYTGASLVKYMGAVPVVTGAATVTYDLTPSGLGALLASGAATALVIGPGATPTFDAYNAPYGSGFYCSIYGPGAYDGFGNAQYPYLTIVLQKTLTTQPGSHGAGGAILITAINNTHIFVSSVQPYTTTDAGGNLMTGGYTGPVTAINQATNVPAGTLQPVAGNDNVNGDGTGNTFAAGYTGKAVSYDPSVTTPGTLVPETWHTVTPQNGWVIHSLCRYRLMPHNIVHVELDIQDNTATTGVMFTLPSGYWATNSQFVPIQIFTGGIPTMATIQVGTTGGLAILNWSQQLKRFIGNIHYSID
jgi:hypothetical protein